MTDPRHNAGGPHDPTRYFPNGEQGPTSQIPQQAPQTQQMPQGWGNAEQTNGFPPSGPPPGNGYPPAGAPQPGQPQGSGTGGNGPKIAIAVVVAVVVLALIGAAIFFFTRSGDDDSADDAAATQQSSAAPTEPTEPAAPAAPAQPSEPSDQSASPAEKSDDKDAALQFAQGMVNVESGQGFSEKMLRGALTGELYESAGMGDMDMPTFTDEAADYAVENVDIDYNEEALKTAQTYRSFDTDHAMTDDALKGILTQPTVGFTEEQVNYAIEHLND